MRKIDIFNHVMPLKFFERIGDYKDIGKRMREVPMLYDLDERFRVMDLFPDYFQVLSAGMPPIEALAGPSQHSLGEIDGDHLFEMARQKGQERSRPAAKVSDRFAAGSGEAEIPGLKPGDLFAETDS